MKNHDQWQPSKYVWRNRKLIGSRDEKEVAVSSRMMTDITAEVYNNNIHKYTNGKLLDLGCGKVPFYILYKDYITDNTCVDWENTLHSNKYLDFECDLTKVLPFEDGQFDTIILSDVLEHIPQPEQLCNEMSRILSRGGRVIMNVPFYYWLHEQPHDYYRYTEFALRRFVENSGLKLLQLESLGGVPEIITDMFAKTIIHVPLVGYPLAVFAQYLTLLFVKTKIGRKISDKTKDKFPLSYFLIAEKSQ